MDIAKRLRRYQTRSVMSVIAYLVHHPNGGMFNQIMRRNGILLRNNVPGTGWS